MCGRIYYHVEMRLLASCEVMGGQRVKHLCGITLVGQIIHSMEVVPNTTSKQYYMVQNQYDDT